MSSMCVLLPCNLLIISCRGIKGWHQVTLKDSAIQQDARANLTAYMTQMLEKKPELADLRERWSAIAVVTTH